MKTSSLSEASPSEAYPNGKFIKEISSMEKINTFGVACYAGIS